MSDVPRFSRIVSVVPYATTDPKCHPHISVFSWGSDHVVMDKVMCDGPTGEVLPLEAAENLRDALDAAIKAARISRNGPIK